jgi:hypothetical protein
MPDRLDSLRLVARVYRTGRELSKQRRGIADVCVCCMPTTRRPPLRALCEPFAPSPYRERESPVFVAARPRQADRCSLAESLPEPPGIILIIIPILIDPSFARALAHRDAIPDTRHQPALRWHDALDSEIKGRLRQILPAAILLAAGADNDPETLRWTSLCYLWS